MVGALIKYLDINTKGFSGRIQTYICKTNATTNIATGTG
jgi:hypothetical protein